MPYSKGELEGELTINELRRLVNAHNVLMDIKLPRGLSQKEIIKVIEKNGYSVDHKKMAIVPKVQMKRKPKVDMKKANEVLPPPKSAEDREKAKQKKMEKDKKIKTEGIRQGAAIQRVYRRKKK
jgi:hypothetical protein